MGTRDRYWIPGCTGGAREMMRPSRESDIGRGIRPGVGLALGKDA